MEKLWNGLRNNRAFRVSTCLVLLLALVAVFAPQLSPYNPLKARMRDAYQAPSAQHWFGTDKLGRDCYTRVIGTEDPTEALKWEHNPINRLQNLTALRLPTLLIAGDSDRVVPYEENGALLEKAYREAGADITVILKEGCDHHPHGHVNVKITADFIDKAYSL